ncbi:DUF262 domain-containing protein [Rossellomorea arthrocnemi]|uniref:DUF262 domain-containing protein n=1 Tax=Rossellomorea arthrocnemi TaxID=2769542 RepID=UPI001919BDA8|nr:DUF262 domain-containing protein [Rossellomorea arthrocnemi]
MSTEINNNNRKYSSKQYTYGHLKGKFKLPSFQRRLVWSIKQKKEFIETLSSGFPFGSILVYQYSGANEITLIDGLQRVSTIQDYEKSPEQYIELNLEAQKLIDTLWIPEEDKGNENIIKALSRTIEELFKTLLRANSPDPLYLLDKINSSDDLARYTDSSIDRKIIQIQHEILQKKHNFLDVDNIEIPTIEFLGDEDELAKVFENLNKGGIKLTKYQVFAAQWYNDIINLNDKTNNQKLLEAIIDRYVKLNENRDIKIENFSPEEMREQNTINLSELCYGIGKLILEVSPTFYSSKKLEQLDDLADEIGYSTIGVVFGVDNKKLHTLKKQIDEVLNADLLEVLINKILKIYININSHFEKYLKQFKQEKSYENKKISNFKFLSYFADLWSNNFTITKDGEVRDNSAGQDRTYSKSLNNLIYYYLKDAALNNWGNAGDSRLNSYYLDKSRTYSIKPSKENFEETLKFWWKDRLLNHSIMFDDISKLILTVYYNLIEDNGLVEGRNNDYEHIVVRAKLKDRYKELIIPGGALGNMMFLDSSINRGKKDLHLYKLLNSGEDIKEDFRKIALYPTEQEINSIESSLEHNTAEATIAFITQRGNAIIEKLVEKMY